MQPTPSAQSVTGIAPPVSEPNERGCPAEYHSPFCECLPANKANRLILAAKELLQVLDQGAIRTCAVQHRVPLYERAADLIDAIGAVEKNGEPVS